MDKPKKILIVSHDNRLKDILSFCLDGWGYEVLLLGAEAGYDLAAIRETSPDVIVIDVESARKDQLDICRSLKDDFATAFIPTITLINKRQLRDHLLNLKQGIDDYMIKPPDPLDLRIRIEMSLRRAQHSIHASPLTGLPGGRFLEEILDKKMKENKPLSFGYIDIDNFKFFNDVYGYQKGDRVILQTAHMIYLVFKNLGGADDFISHIGGDDFAFITTPDKYEQLCRKFIQMFDNIIPFHYSKGHRQQGFILTRDRSRKIRKIPLMSVSVAVVNRDDKSAMKTSISVNERIAEIKRYLKTIPESKFMADRRETRLTSQYYPIVNKRPNNPEVYKPLGQILLDKGIVSYEQLDEALKFHWRKGLKLGQTLKELGFLDEAQLQTALSDQKVSLTPFTI